MPNNKSAWKRMRQTEIKRMRNKNHRSSLRRAIRDFKAIEDSDAARQKLPEIVSTIDKSVKKGIVHHRTAARIKSRLSRKTV